MLNASPGTTSDSLGLVFAGDLSPDDEAIDCGDWLTVDEAESTEDWGCIEETGALVTGVGVRAAGAEFDGGGGADIMVSIDSPGMTSSTSMASSVLERLKADVGRTGALPFPVSSVVGPMLFKNSSTVFVGTASASALRGPGAAEVAADVTCFLRDAMTALRARSSCLRCCSMSTRLGAAVDDEAELGTNVAAVADSVP